MTRASSIITVCALSLLISVVPAAGPCFAASGAVAASQDEMRELKQRFEERYRRIVRAKSEGTIGETFDGYLAPLAERFLDDDAELAALVKSENNDREKLYDLLAKDVKQEVDEPARDKVTPEIVAERNARRSFRNAKDGDYLRMQDGVWIRKRDERAYEAILKLKESGAVREGDDGLVTIDGGGADARSALDAENDRRREMFQEIARQADSTAEAIAREHAKSHESRVQSRDE